MSCRHSLALLHTKLMDLCWLRPLGHAGQMTRWTSTPLQFRWKESNPSFIGTWIFLNTLPKFPDGFLSLSFKLSRLLPPDTESRITNCSFASLECLRWQLIATPNSEIVICTLHLQMLQDTFGSNGSKIKQDTCFESEISLVPSVWPPLFDRASNAKCYTF